MNDTDMSLFAILNSELMIILTTNSDNNFNRVINKLIFQFFKNPHQSIHYFNIVSNLSLVTIIIVKLGHDAKLYSRMPL